MQVEYMKVHGFHGNPSWILKKEGVWGLLMTNLTFMKNCPDGVGVGACKVS